jgi:hypothetical protein
MNSRVAVLLPFRLRLHSSSTAKSDLLTNPYPYKTLIKNGGIPGHLEEMIYEAMAA